jgi:hypothetical protein
VLPFRCNGKLCRSCTTERNTDEECAYEDVAERVLIGTWVIGKVITVVQKRYEVTEIFELYEYVLTRYVPQTRRDGLFVQNIDMFLKLKTESS